MVGAFWMLLQYLSWVSLQEESLTLSGEVDVAAAPAITPVDQIAAHEAAHLGANAIRVDCEVLGNLPQHYPAPPLAIIPRLAEMRNRLHEL